MNLNAWLEERRPSWQRLEAIVDRLYRRGPRGTSADDLASLLELYQAACADLAKLRASGADPALISPLNRLITRAHGQVYRGSASRSWRIGDFFFVRYPRLFRETWKFTLASFLVSAAAL